MTSPYLANLAAAALGSGLAITSPTTGVSATYPVDENAQRELLKTQVYINTNGHFPAGQTAWSLPDIAGTPHAIPSTGVFLAIATAVADYVAQLVAIINGSSSATALPAPTVTLTV